MNYRKKAMLMAGALLCLNLSLYSQSISLKMSNVSVKKAMTELQTKSGYSFVYIAGDVDTDRTVSINASQLKDAVAQILKGQNVSYEIQGKNIVIKKGSQQQVTSGKRKKVTGTVKDANGEPIIGATVVEKGTTNGTVTDFDGNYTLELSDNGILAISYIGYESQEFAASQIKSGALPVTLKEDTEVMEEVVVVGYGSQKKVNLTGAVASINTNEIKDRVQSDVLSAVQGTVPGVTIISRPGANPSINFRGRGNLGTSEPLYVIDGAIADATFFSNLDPNSIESISFLKDAASSAIYGSRAAYGVVLVTTKTGKKEKMNISYSGMIGMDMPTYLPEVLDSWDYAALLNEAKYNVNPAGGKNQAFTDEEIGWFKDGSKPDYYPNTNWADLVLDKHVFTTQHSLNFSGGGDKVRFFCGLGYLDKGHFVPGKGSDRYNLNFNIQADITKWFTLKSGVKYIRNNSHTDNGVPAFNSFLLVPSIMVSRQSNGEWGSIAGGKDATQNYINRNPLRVLSYDNWTKSSTENSMYDLGFDIKPIKNLVLSGQMNYKRYEYKTKNYTATHSAVNHFESGNPIPGTESTSPNSMSMHWISNSTMLTTFTAKYDMNFSKHTINLLAGTSYEHYNYERLYSKRTDFVSDGLKDIEQGNDVSKEVPEGSSIVESKMLSYFGRLNYSYNDRYLLEVNVRADGSSRFYKDNRWGVFPSVSAGWRINEESFMKPVKWINNMKLRVSYGTLGNINNVGYYDYFQLLSTGANYNFSDKAVKGVLEAQIPNTSLGWETVALTDIGFDLDILNNKLSLSADYYIKKTSDILLGYNVPRETGIWSNPSLNLAEVQNKGFEMAITHRNKIGDFSYSISANIATNNNKITDLAGSDNMIRKGGNNISYILKEGESIGSFYGLKTDGLYTQEEIDAGKYYIYGRHPKAGDIKYVPQRDNVKYFCDLDKGESTVAASITDDDRTVIGCDVPDFTYGVNLNLQWKNWELSVFGQGVFGTVVAFESEQVFAFQEMSSVRKYHLLRWTEENPNPYAPVPRIYGGTSLDEYNRHFSDNHLFDADYFRFKTISLGYMFPKSMMAKFGISSLKLFLTGENLFTIRADKIMKDFDPEAATGRGVGAFGTKSVAFGVNLSF